MATFRRGYANVTANIDTLVITHDVKRAFSESNLQAGIVLVFMPIGSTGVTLLENDPKIHEDFKKWIETQVPATTEKRPDRRSGSGRSFAHLRAKLVGYSVQIPVAEGKLQMSPWQEVVLYDFDDKIGRREFFILVTGEGGGGG
ncbi:MAG: secondary thiamine-phosphate synthase enzyme YjbQ [bacterium]